MTRNVADYEKSRIPNRGSLTYEELVNRFDKMLAPCLAHDWPNLPVVRAQGLYLYGLDGKRYMDFISSFGVVNLGHNHPAVIDAARKQMENQIHGAVGFTLHESVLRLAALLPEILPGHLDMSFFGPSGSEAVEGSIKLREMSPRDRALSHLWAAFMVVRTVRPLSPPQKPFTEMNLAHSFRTFTMSHMPTFTIPRIPTNQKNVLKSQLTHFILS